MQKFTIGTAIAGLLAAGAFGLAGTAAAAPTGGSNAAETVKTLRDMGYSVQLNGSLTGSLDECTVTGVHGLSNMDAAGQRVDAGQFATAYVDISCPSLND
jgi:hypothetical protein